jgi:phospholipase/carboxylesterase
MSKARSILFQHAGSATGSAPTVVYFHGRGSSEREGQRLAPLLRTPNLLAYRGPIPEGAGFAWFRNQGIGVAEEASLSTQTSRVRGWIDADMGSDEVWLCGFSNGAAFAGELFLRTPSRYAGLIMIGGCFATDSFPLGRLAGKPVLFCRGREDQVIPRNKTEAALSYLTGLSGAKATIVEFDGGHEIPSMLIEQFETWFP